MTPENMGSFLWVCNHGNHWEYRAAGSTRRSDVKVPFGYLLLWDMIRCTKAAGAERFDMRGVRLADGDESALEGFSRFKRYFSREVVEIGAEWELELVPVRAKIATTVSSGVRHMRGRMVDRS